MSALVKSVSVDDLLNQREAIVARLTQMQTLWDEVNKLSLQYFNDSRAFGSADYFVNGLNGRHGSFRLWDRKESVNIGLDSAIQRVDKSGWKHLLHESGMRTLMNNSMRNQWDALLYNDSEKVPVLSRGTIEATFKQLHADSQSIFEQGVIDVFKGLSWEYKTNLPQKFGKRIVLGWVRSYSGNGSACDKIDDLCRVFSILDGGTVADHRNTDGAELARMARATQSGEHGFKYFGARWFKNNNAHITFSRLDLVEKLNRIIAKHYPGALPAPK